MKRHWIRFGVIVLGIFLLLFGVLYGVFELSRSRTFQFFGGLTARVETDHPVIALTFDDAPTEYTDEVLSVLQENGVPATFYVIGRSLEKYPEVAERIVQGGHELGNHSYSHERFYFKSLSFIENEITKTNQLIRKAGYQGEITFRPPNGKKLVLLPYYLNQKYIKTIMWDVEPDTFVPGDKDKIVTYTVGNTKPGSIILMHPFCKDTCRADREALPEIIKALKDDGYRFVTVSELLKNKKGS